MDAIELLDIVYEIYNSTTDYDERRLFYKEKYADFAEKYTYIFEMLCKPRFNLHKFVTIVNNLKTTKKRKKCSDEVNNEILLYNLKDVFHQQSIAHEYLL